MSDSHVAVTFAEVAQAASDIKNIQQQIDQRLSDLKRDLQPIVAQWSGSASESYNEAQRRWDQAANDLNATLAAIGSAVQQAGEGYQSAEGAAKKLWG